MPDTGSHLLLPPLPGGGVARAGEGDRVAEEPPLVRPGHVHPLVGRGDGQPAAPSCTMALDTGNFELRDDFCLTYDSH